MTSTRRGEGSGSGGRMRTGGGGAAPCGRPHRKLKLESTDVILSYSRANEKAVSMCGCMYWGSLLSVCLSVCLSVSLYRFFVLSTVALPSVYLSVCLSIYLCSLSARLQALMKFGANLSTSTP